MVHQHFMLVDTFTVLENVVLGVESGMTLKTSLDDARDTLIQLEKEYHLEVDVDAFIEDLPVGLLQRVEILKALYRKADILILDEPTNHLDIESREALVEALTAYSGAVILVSHDMHLLSLVADRLWLVSNGAVRPYEEDLDAYRAMLLASDKPQKKKEETVKPKRPSRDAILALKSEVKKGEERIEKLNEMRDKLAKKLADPALYEEEKRGEAEVWQKKYAEVMNGLDRAEELWMKALEKLERAETGI